MQASAVTRWLWLNQTGISLASGALRSWWIRLELIRDMIMQVLFTKLRLEPASTGKEAALLF
jgi:hypothetical protein